jgi:hypothetical protein
LDERKSFRGCFDVRFRGEESLVEEKENIGV